MGILYVTSSSTSKLTLVANVLFAVVVVVPSDAVVLDRPDVDMSCFVSPWKEDDDAFALLFPPLVAEFVLNVGSTFANGVDCSQPIFVVVVVVVIAFFLYKRCDWGSDNGTDQIEKY